MALRPQSTYWKTRYGDRYGDRHPRARTLIVGLPPLWEGSEERREKGCAPRRNSVIEAVTSY